MDFSSTESFLSQLEEAAVTAVVKPVPVKEEPVIEPKIDVVEVDQFMEQLTTASFITQLEQAVTTKKEIKSECESWLSDLGFSVKKTTILNNT